jgi:hypothetical protein
MTLIFFKLLLIPVTDLGDIVASSLKFGMRYIPNVNLTERWRCLSPS